MNKFLKWFLIVLASVLLIVFVGFQYIQHETKQHSPEQMTVLEIGKTEISVFYNRPYKKGRVIFGELVPYGKVWRTGANEATLFTTNVDLEIQGKTLKAGEYTLWTIPHEDKWEVIFNSKQYPWGVDWNENALREPEHDALVAEVSPERISQAVEQFTINLEEGTPLMMHLIWDRVKVSISMKEI